MSLTSRRRRGLESTRTISPDALQELIRAAGEEEGGAGPTIVRRVVGPGMAVSSRAAVSVALQHPAEALTAVHALSALVDSDDSPKSLSQALARLETTDLSPVLAASSSDRAVPELPDVRFEGAGAVADAAAAAVAALASPRSFINHGQTHIVHALAQLNDSGLLFGPRCREFMLAGYSRIGLVDSALDLASTMRAELAEPGSSSWAWHSLPREGAMHILRAGSLRGDSSATEKAMVLVEDACRADGIPVPSEAIRLAKRVIGIGRRSSRTNAKRGAALAGRLPPAAMNGSKERPASERV
jgi:hypothetical protein